MLRSGLLGIALVAVVMTAGGCGGGSDDATHELGSLRSARCNVAAVEDQLRGLEAGISATKREFEGPEHGPNRQQILRSMEENARLIHRQLPSLEQCAQDVLREAEGKPVNEPSPPALPAHAVVGHRLGPARVEPGDQALPASPCSSRGKNGTTTIYIWPDAGGCARIAPGERLRVVNKTGIGGPADAVAVRVQLGNYELWLGPNQEGLIPAAVETYLDRGSHSVRTAGGLGGTVLLLPRVCAIRPPEREPGEELCFR